MNKPKSEIDNERRIRVGYVLEYQADLAKTLDVDIAKKEIHSRIMRGLNEVQVYLEGHLCNQQYQMKEEEPNFQELLTLNARYKAALQKLACLGNGDIPGNSDGNLIAREALWWEDKNE